MLSPVSFQTASSKLQRASSSAAVERKAPSNEPFDAAKDLVEITGGTTSSALKGALKNGARFVLDHGLSLAGLALAGPVGMVMGSLASGAVSALQHSDKGAKEMLSAGLKKTGISLGLGAVAGVPGLLLPGIAAVAPSLLLGAGTSAALGIDFKERLHKPDFEVSAPKLATRFHGAVKRELEKSGRSSQQLPSAPRVMWLGSEGSKKAQISIAKTALIASKLLGPAATVALAAEIGREGVSTAEVGRLAAHPGPSEHVSRENLDGVEVIRVKGFRQSERTDGLAHFDRVYLDADLPATGDAKADFVLGHEKSHVSHLDSSATLAQKAVLEAVENVYHLTGKAEEKTALAGLHDELEMARLAESREIEFRADQDGLAFAMSRGHSQEAVYSAAQDLFKNEPDTDPTYREHPEGKARLQAIQSAPIKVL